MSNGNLYRMKWFGSLIIVVVLSGCSPYTVRDFILPEVLTPDRFTEYPVSPQGLNGGKVQPYWMAYNEPSLTALMSDAVGQNFSIADAYARIRRERAVATIAGADRFPTISTEGQGQRSRIETGQSIVSASGFSPVGTLYQNRFGLRNGLSYEVDFWRRISSTRKAELLRLKATESDFEEAVLAVSRELFTSWITASNALQLQTVLEQQILSSETFLDLTKLRYSLGGGTALDVFEQKEQLASLRSELPPVKQLLDEALHRLSVLLGKPPGSFRREDIQRTFPKISESLPKIRPVDLLILRPDLKSSLLQLQANEHDVAAAVAARYPQLSIGFDYDFSTNSVQDIFPNKIFFGFGSILLPLIDGGKRRAVVEQQKAKVDQSIAQFSERFLVALQEVEDALSAEKHQRELLQRLHEQYEAASNTLRESKLRYMNGLVDYLRVLVALQATQQLERTLLTEEKQLLLFRNQWFLSIGGKIPVTTEKTYAK